MLNVADSELLQQTKLQFKYVIWSLNLRIQYTSFYFKTRSYQNPKTMCTIITSNPKNTNKFSSQL